MHLETPRLRLYPMSLDQLKQAKRDLASVVRSFQANMEPFRFWDMWSKRRIYAAKARWVVRYPEAWLMSTSWLVIAKIDHFLVAEVGFKGPPGAKRSLEIGYSTREKYRNCGIMTEAVGALCRFAFTQSEHKVYRVCAYTLPDNLASQRVLKRNGFIRTSVPGRYWLWEKLKE